MKKLLLLFSACTLLSFASDAQEYLGLSTGNYSGLHGVMLQPANVADNRYKFDINLFSTNIGFRNNYLGFSRKFFVNNRFSFKDYDSYADFKKNVLTTRALNGDNVSFNLNNRLNLPSVMITTGKKSGIAIGLQSRTAIAVENMNGEFAEQLYNEFANPITGRSYDLGGMEVSAMNWFEGSLTYGRVLIDNGKHFLKAGVTGKYLGGISSAYLNVDDMRLTATSDSSIRLDGNKVGYGHSATSITSELGRDYRPDASGVGFDAGLVYEFRGRINKFKFLKFNKKDEEVYSTTRRDKNKYSFKVGVSLLDVGQLTFNSVPLARDFSSSLNNINIRNNGINSIRTFDTFLSNNVNYLANDTARQYSVAMPTALSAQFDLHLFKGFYVNAMAYMPFTSLNKDADFRVFTPNYYAVTPRWESRMAGLYVPIVYNNNNLVNRELTIGSTVRLGPLFVGTSNFLTLFKQDNIRAADLHLGFKLPLAHGKPSKTADWFKKFTNDADDELEVEQVKEVDEIIEEKTKTKKKEKKEEKVAPTPAPQPIQIIINNYNSASKSKGQGNTQRIVDVNPQTGETMQRTIVVGEDGTQYMDSNSSQVIQNYSNQGEDVKELNNMQEQIEYLKFKLKQKEELLNEMQLEQNRIQDNSSNEESKKKIDSLTNEYLYNNNFVYEPAARITDKSSTEATLFELRKELLALDRVNTKLDRQVTELAKSNELLINRLDNQEGKTSVNELDYVIKNLQTSEKLALKPTKVYYHASPDYGYDDEPVRKKGETIQPTITRIQADRNANIKETVKTSSADVNVAKTVATTANTEEIKNATEENDRLRNEVKDLRSELKSFEKKASKKKRRWVLFGSRRDSKIIRNEDVENLETKVQEIVKRDTVFIEKPVEKIVTKVIRDTVINVVEKNNTITETKVETVEVDNTVPRLLNLPAYFVLFDINSASIKKIFMSKLNYYAAQLKKYPELKLMLTGHTDASGNAKMNLALSERRARQVRNYLIQKGVSRNRISTSFNGDKDPLANNKTKVGKSQNRRVEVLFVN
jgi:outer membrane protein OmpA-like peptidoglycan-associated protein